MSSGANASTDLMRFTITPTITSLYWMFSLAMSVRARIRGFEFIVKSCRPRSYCAATSRMEAVMTPQHTRQQLQTVATLQASRLKSFSAWNFARDILRKATDSHREKELGRKSCLAEWGAGRAVLVCVGSSLE